MISWIFPRIYRRNLNECDGCEECAAALTGYDIGVSIGVLVGGLGILLLQWAVPLIYQNFVMGWLS